MSNRWTAEQDRRMLLEVVNSFSPTVSQKVWDQIGPILGVTPKACKDRFLKIKKESNAAAATNSNNEKTPATTQSTMKTTTKTSNELEKRPVTPEQREPSPRKRKTINYAEDGYESDNMADSENHKWEMEHETGQKWRFKRGDDTD